MNFIPAQKYFGMPFERLTVKRAEARALASGIHAASAVIVFAGVEFLMRVRTLLLVALIVAAAPAARGAVVFEKTSAYHTIRVLDQQGVRTLSFDGSMETQMSLVDPLKGHFEYTEYFHMPWLWNPNMTNVLMIGLGGGSTQRAYQHYYTNVMVDTVEIDPTVFQVAKDYFHLKESRTLKVHVSDGRVFLRRSQKKYDAIILDAYVANRYGSFIPYHLATKEFFELANEHLVADGVVAYNVIGTFKGWRADCLGAIYATLKSVFPQVYLFPANTSQNVVIIGTKSAQKVPNFTLHQRASDLVNKRRVTMATFRQRLYSIRIDPPPAAKLSPVLTDDFAPIDGLLNTAP